MTDNSIFSVRSFGEDLFGGSEGLHQPYAKLLANEALSSLTHDRTLLAFAQGQRLLIADAGVTPTEGKLISVTATDSLLAENETITAIQWISFQASKHISVEVTILLAGTSLGYLHWYTATGDLLHRQRVHQTACCSIQGRRRGQGLDCEDSSEEITIGFEGGCARVFSSEMLSFYLQVSRGSAGSEVQLSHTKWEFPRNTGRRQTVTCLGLKAPSLHDRMLGRSPSLKLSILSGGASPALATHEALEWGNAGVMAVVSELATGVAGLAKTLAVGRPNGYRAGLGSWLGRSSKQEVEDPEKVVTQPGHSSSLALSIPDEPRVVTSIVLSPRGSLAAAADNLGRVLLFDFCSLTVLQIWKSYRHAQIGWLSVSSQDNSGKNLLVLYSGKRARFEVWEPRGKCIADVPSCRHGILFNLPFRFGSSNALGRVYLLDCETGKVSNIADLARIEGN